MRLDPRQLKTVALHRRNPRGHLFKMRENAALVALLISLACVAQAKADAKDSSTDGSPSQVLAPLTTGAGAGNLVEDGEIQVFAQRLDLADKENFDVGDIRNTGNLGPSLDQQSGLETQGEGMGKAWNTLSIRGQSFRETVVLLNGVRVPEGFNLGTIPTENIVSVKVVEGPEALAYGSDAIGGVINIVTKKTEPTPLRLQFGIGSFNTYQYQVALPTLVLGSFTDSLSGSWYHSDGYLQPVTGYHNLTFPFADEEHWDVTNDAAWASAADRIELTSTYFRHSGSSPDADNVIAAGTGQYDLDGRQDAYGIQAMLTESHAMGGWKLETAVSGDDSDVLRENPIGADPTSGVYEPYVNDYLDYGVKVHATGSVGDLLPDVNVGVEANQEGLASGLYGEYHSRWTGTFAQSGTLKLAPSLSLALNNHVDLDGIYGLIDNPSATLAWTPIQAWRWHVSAGQGTKLPTYDQLYLPYTSFAALPPGLAAQFAGSPFAGAFAGDKGNSNLLPEQSYNFELGSDLWAGSFLVQASGFANLYHDLINPILDSGDNFWTYANLGRATFWGTEDSVKFHWSDVFVPYVSYTYIDARDQNGGTIQGRMHQKATGGFELRPEKNWSLDFHARYVDRNPMPQSYLTDLGLAQPATDYWNLSAEAKYDISAHLSGYISIDNILDQPIASFQGIPSPGRSFETGLQGRY